MDRDRALGTVGAMELPDPPVSDRSADAVPRFKVTDARRDALRRAGSKSRRIAPATQ